MAPATTQFATTAGPAPDGSAYLERLARHAAQRLGPPRRFEDLAAAYPHFLKLEEHRVRLAHQFGEGGRVVAQHRADLMDLVLRHVFAGAMAVHPDCRDARGRVPVALVAVGGYGRRELNPFSDVDIVFVHPDAAATTVTSAEGLIRDVLAALVELGIELGSRSTLSIAEAIRLANQDMKTKTSLLDSRFLAGEAAWFSALQTEFDARCLKGREEEYVAWRMEDQARRHQRYGSAVSMQEPNVKNGCGGLRDYQNLCWVGALKTGGGTVAALARQGRLSDREARQLDEAYDFIQRVRNDLHYLCGSKVCSDVLTVEQQEVVAGHLGYRGASGTRQVEAFMRDYYLHARNIFHISETLTERLSLNVPAARRWAPVFGWMLGNRRAPPATDGFVTRDQRLHPVDSTVFDQDAGRLLRVFRYLQQEPVPPSAELRQLIRQKLPLVRGDFLEAPSGRMVFEAILSERGGVGRALRLMHEVDFLGRYVPEFRGLTCLPQHDFAHRYTADEHTLVCLEKLDALLGATERREQPYRRLYEKLRDPFPLSLALLLHDTGKATGARPATEASALFAQTVGRRLQLSPGRRRTVIFLIDHQHTLAHTALHRNLDDPQTIAAFASIVGTIENLDALVLFSWADAQGTDQSSWTEWKDQLVWQLYDLTAQHLAGGRAADRGPRDRDALARAVAAALPADYAEEASAHVSYMPDRYLAAYGEADIRLHLQLFREFLARREADETRALVPAVRTVLRPEQGHWEVLIGGWDRRDLLTRVAGCFSAARLNILAAGVYPREDGLALVTLRVTGSDGRLPRYHQALEEAESLLVRTFGSENLDLTTLLRRPGTSDPLRRRSADFPTRIEVTNDVHPDFTLIEVVTPDRVGLLHDLLSGLDRLGLRIPLSHISTEKGAARDTFFVTEANHHRVGGEARRAEIQRALSAAIGL